ncbi:MAG: prolyl oligopeptidase family serine peptidase [Bacteroidota bacterium]
MRSTWLASVLMLLFSICNAQSFSLKSVLSYPFPSELTSAKSGNKIAWAVNEQGRRNIYVAEGPAYTLRKLTSFENDDAQEITSLSISDDGKWVVFVRGGDHGSRDGTIPVNAASLPLLPKVQVCSLPYEGGKLLEIGEGDNPVITPDSKNITFVKGGQIMIAAIDGSVNAKGLFYSKGTNGGMRWSPDGKKLAFVCSRVDHSFIGVYSGGGLAVQWISPGLSKDTSPRWSPDGNELVFIRTPGTGGEADSILARRHQPWEIWKAGTKGDSGKMIWKAPETLSGSFPSMDGGANLMWADEKIIYSSYEDGWPHLYAMNTDGSGRVLLTPGNFAVEHVQLDHSRKELIFSANTGRDEEDLERRHIYKVSIESANMRAITTGKGLETYPVITGDKADILFFSATAQRPLLPAKYDVLSKKITLIGSELMPSDFPEKLLVIPTQVSFKAEDGGLVYGQLFRPTGKTLPGNKKPAIVYVHGGPQRQMLLGWHHMDYYSIDYALNQYLVSLGFTVLSVNYRLGTGYGYEFHKPANAGAQGAIEYLDVKAAGEWLAKQPNVDPQKIGIYGGSYGGYLVALALGKDSKLFAAGVDIHGVNNRFTSAVQEVRLDAPDAALAEQKARASSPVSYLSTWTSPVLLIHADDDRNVNFSQSIDLAKRFDAKKFPYEFLVIPDDTHHWMRFGNALRVSEATAEFLKRKLIK